MLTKFHPMHWSHKLAKIQENYHALVKELLSNIMVLEEFCSVVLGTKLFIYTDHKYLTFAMLSFAMFFTDIHLWMNVVCDPTILYHPGKKDGIATFVLLPPMT